MPLLPLLLGACPRDYPTSYGNVHHGADGFAELVGITCGGECFAEASQWSQIAIDHGDAPVPTTDACRDLCQATSGCEVWTHTIGTSGGECSLMRAMDATISSLGLLPPPMADVHDQCTISVALTDGVHAMAFGDSTAACCTAIEASVLTLGHRDAFTLPPPVPPPPPSPTPPAYVANAGTGNWCEAGQPITDQSECRAAAQELRGKSEFSGFRFRDTIYMSEVSGGCLVYDGGVSEYHGFYLNSHAGSGGPPGSHKVRRRLWYRPPCGTAAFEPPPAHPEACRRMPPRFTRPRQVCKLAPGESAPGARVHMSPPPSSPPVAAAPPPPGRERYFDDAICATSQCAEAFGAGAPARNRLHAETPRPLACTTMHRLGP